jgi:hypothetical protein
MSRILNGEGTKNMKCQRFFVYRSSAVILPDMYTERDIDHHACPCFQTMAKHVRTGVK